MALLSLKNPEILLLRDGLELSFGANQEWYGKFWQKRAGCGPTVASTLALYISRTRPGCEALVENSPNTKEGFVGVMDSMWEHVTPGYRGVNATVMLRRGLFEYAFQRGVQLAFRVIDIGIDVASRPDAETVRAFVTEAMELDRPIAFLNLHSGEEKRLDRWHWVILVAYDADTGYAVMYDQGKESRFDLSLWLKTTKLGGGFVTADV
ncbi:MAG: hypothetical protein FWE66_03745 [Oscillospiraceae bacterium]|nr:hypothetical protein [Oscillospiraceae bacterium]